MKKFITTTLLVSILLFCASCKKKTYRSEMLKPASVEYSHEDSSQVKTHIDLFVQAMNNHDYYAVADMMRKVTEGKCYKFNADDRAQMVKAYEFMKIRKVAWEFTILRDYLNNEVVLDVEMEDPINPEGEPKHSKLKLNPVFIDGAWFITFLDKRAEGVKNIYEENDSVQ